MRRSNGQWLAGIAVASLAACTAEPAKETTGASWPIAAEKVQQQIAKFEAGEANGVDRKIVFGDMPLYLISSPCCDIVNYLYTADGKKFCAPTGGFTGRGDGKCPPEIGPLLRQND